MARTSEKPYNGGMWTEARMHAFIKGALRNASMRWPPKHRVKSKARIKRGLYECAGYAREPHNVTASRNHRGQRLDNVYVDHINPVIDPSKGFENWDTLISRLFCEEEGLQVLCWECHGNKTKDERNAK